MNGTVEMGASARLDRLDGFLKEDPGNAALLADACETAIAGGAHVRAQAYLQAAQRLGLEGPEWTFRRAQLAIARRELADAAALLCQLLDGPAPQSAVVHDLAYVHYLQEDFAGCKELLEPWVQGGQGADAADAMQVLWLRATHRMQLVAQAWDWIALRRAQGTLCTAASGVASLVAIDAGDFEAARKLADAALAADSTQVEALVARGCVAVAQGETTLAAQVLERALQRQPADGRIWSALGFASLRAGRLPLARSQLQEAVRFMPGHIGTRHALGWACLLQGDQPGAHAAFDGALALDRNFAESHGALALALALQGREAEARRHLDAAHRLDANNVTGRYVQALLAGEAADAARLQALVKRLLDRPGLFGRKLSEAVAASVAAAR